MTMTQNEIFIDAKRTAWQTFLPCLIFSLVLNSKCFLIHFLDFLLTVQKRDVKLDLGLSHYITSLLKDKIHLGPLASFYSLIKFHVTQRPESCARDCFCPRASPSICVSSHLATNQMQI